MQNWVEVLGGSCNTPDICNPLPDPHRPYRAIISHQGVSPHQGGGGGGSDECLSIKITSTIVHVSDEQKETQT